ncbi:MAG: ABC transporter ATP-binding protein [Chloroflexi bacterium]|uniref:ABC transporter ATP-binding protein n=1 Tax=Candidatus Chlorohelix allophototropha TaxID=3003348 RepID=A0A8T7LS83_9CHLR|nr:ABC transporter ATP-binding protein [Chloroflexota bacterium]WJW66750.1 ABC transporter ATP-binding protein [Chloroflexota bacterium L227-S17]
MSNAPDIAIPEQKKELVVETRQLVRKFGAFVAVNSMDMQIERGAIYGFIGPNGAGKTTTMRILASLLQPNSGEAYVCGYSVTDQSRKNLKAIRASIGFMPDYFGIYDRMKAWEYLDFFASAYYVEARKRAALIEELLELVDLSEKRNTFIEDLSRGMKQRLGLARTLVHDPQLLILDEPASGLDPRARVELRELLRELSRMGKTVLISSHILTELAEMCTHIGIIERGTLLAQGKVSDIIRQLRHINRLVRIKVRLGAEELPLAAEAAIKAAPGVTELKLMEETNDVAGHIANFEATVQGDEAEMHTLLRYLIACNLFIFDFSERQDNLEDIFFKITKGLVA